MVSEVAVTLVGKVMTGKKTIAFKEVDVVLSCVGPVVWRYIDVEIPN